MNSTKRILMALQSGRKLTGLDILNEFQVYRASAVIHRLRLQGHPIVTDIITVPSGKKVARYSYGQQTLPV